MERLKHASCDCERRLKDVEFKLRIASEALQKCGGFDYSAVDRAIITSEALRALGLKPTVTAVIHGR
jgi:hypothetical protein